MLAVLQLAWIAGSIAKSTLGNRRQRRAGHQSFLEKDRVLIVEDDPTVAACIADEVHAASGEPVGPVSSVCAALHIIENEKVDGVVLDVRLEDGDATPVALSLVKKRVPFVIVSGLDVPASIATINPDAPVFRKPLRLSYAVRGLVNELRRGQRTASPRPV